ncbi:recombinase family protein [Salmonirosea aquatica]|uniref:Resolvase/invertase-type recombinase catalytic domain-containing protein n=1 Tax=Salmonirosea aquatica TaxID=2654236 RepID=A0A7C9FTU5_9BACT|nr:hypothetical protein [Cytophagaceae bacterium SJW1-29]
MVLRSPDCPAYADYPLYNGLGSCSKIFRKNAQGAGHGQIVSEYTDVKSGKRNDRPELMRAISRCKAEGAVLLIAKLDRLTGSGQHPYGMFHQANSAGKITQLEMAEGLL